MKIFPYKGSVISRVRHTKVKIPRVLVLSCLITTTFSHVHDVLHVPSNSQLWMFTCTLLERRPTLTRHKTRPTPVGSHLHIFLVTRRQNSSHGKYT